MKMTKEVSEAFIQNARKKAFGKRHDALRLATYEVSEEIYNALVPGEHREFVAAAPSVSMFLKVKRVSLPCMILEFQKPKEVPAYVATDPTNMLALWDAADDDLKHELINKIGTRITNPTAELSAASTELAQYLLELVSKVRTIEELIEVFPEAKTLLPKLVRTPNVERVVSRITEIISEK